MSCQATNEGATGMKRYRLVFWPPGARQWKEGGRFDSLPDAIEAADALFTSKKPGAVRVLGAFCTEYWRGNPPRLEWEFGPNEGEEGASGQEATGHLGGDTGASS
jgi:hypothetical protein